MIRINLLPVKAAKRREYGRQQLILFVLMIVAELVILYFIYSSKTNEYTTVFQKNQNIRKSIKTLEAKTKDFAKVKQRRQELLHQKEVLDSLERKRSGPVQVMDELRFLLYLPTGLDANTLASEKGWNVKWDSTYLWLESYYEEDGDVLIQGYAKTNDDVAEFFKRMTTSEYFTSVDLNKSELQKFAQTGTEMTGFTIRCRVAYTLKPKNG